MNNGSSSDIEYNDKNEYIKSLETSIRVLQDEVNELRELEKTSISADENNNKQNSGIEVDFFNMTNHQEVIENLHSIINKEFSIIESAVLFLDSSSKIEIINPLISDIMINNIKYLEEEGIIDWVMNQATLKNIPNLNDSQEAAGNYFLLVPLRLCNTYVGVFIASTELSNGDLYEKQKSAISAVCQNAAIAIDNIRSKKEISIVNHKLAELQRKMLASAKMITQAEIAGIITQELDEPMKIINAHLNMIESGIGEIPPRIRIIKKQFNKFETIINRLNHITNANRDEDITEIDLNLIIKDIIDVIYAQMQRDNIKIEVDLNNEPVYIKCKKNLIEQMFIDIFLFQRDRMPDGGIIAMSTAVYQNKVVITLIDNGIGIDNKNADDLFEPSSNNEFGSLYFVKQIIDNLKGKISVFSDSNSGNSFKISLPFF